MKKDSKYFVFVWINDTLMATKHYCKQKVADWKKKDLEIAYQGKANVKISTNYS